MMLVKQNKTGSESSTYRPVTEWGIGRARSICESPSHSRSSAGCPLRSQHGRATRYQVRRGLGQVDGHGRRDGPNELREQLAESEKGSLDLMKTLHNTVELAKNPSMIYKTASLEKRRELLKSLLSNLLVSGKNVEITLSIPFRLIAERQKTADGGAYRGTCRTWEHLLQQLRRQCAAEIKSTNCGLA
jgi:hypothetical protein